MRPVVQISLDVTTIQEAVETAEMALRAGVDWLEAGTPLILAEGLRAVRELRARFPETPIIADLKTMDGGYLEAEMMGKAGANFVVVMARAHEETLKVVCQAGRDHGIGVMGDNLGCPDMVAGARLLEDLAAMSSFIISGTMSVVESRPVASELQRPSINFAKLSMRSRCRCKPSADYQSIKRFRRPALARLS